MEHYIVSARKYRPSTFASVVGQKALTATLKNAVATNRLAHSYLFCGSRGVGKTSCARIFAKTINCEHRTPDGEACNECDSCRAFNSGASMNIIELDAASNNGVDAMKGLIEQVQVPPSQGRYRVFIVDEVHMLTSQAFNAFLKTLEEPPAYVVFILATTEKHKIIPTILSRCQIYDFHRITVPDMVEHMLYVANNEGIQAEPAALNVIAQKADGAMRDALSILDQVAASSGGNITYQSVLDNLNVLDDTFYARLLDAFVASDVFSAWMIYKEIRDNGFDSLFFINGLAAYLRDLAVASSPATITLMEATDDVRQRYAAAAAKCTPDFLLKAMNLCNEADLNYRTSSSKQFLVEITLAKICQLLSPSPGKAGDGEGRLKPISAGNPGQEAAVAPGKAANTAPAPRQTPMHAPAPSVPKPQPMRAQTQPYGGAPVPPKPVMPVPPRKGGTVLRTPRVSLRGDGGTQSSTSAADAGRDRMSAPSEMRQAPFTAQAVTDAWNAYISAHPKDHILINTMRSGMPVAVEGEPNSFSMTVENDIQRQAVTDVMPSLLGHMRDALGNDHFTLQVVINQGAPPRHTLNDRELLGTMIERNPVIQKYIDAFRLIPS
ncbi:MAG: DNA polymerase III subunit gamma/tau [Muribaculaceae bacterium]|nr:DNA polymerase III subunit gamma/tau [Muribaculaceae bacterium]